MDTADEPLLRFFTHDHLATQLVAILPRTAERTVALRRLLDSKDAAVRAKVDTTRDTGTP